MLYVHILACILGGPTRIETLFLKIHVHVHVLTEMDFFLNLVDPNYIDHIYDSTLFYRVSF